jgi:hypothetical protein
LDLENRELAIVVMSVPRSFIAGAGGDALAPTCATPPPLNTCARIMYIRGKEGFHFVSFQFY